MLESVGDRRRPWRFALLAGLGLGIGVIGVIAAVSPATAAFFRDLLKVYTPRQLCMNGEAPVIWLHAVSDLLIGVAYFSIPIALALLLRKRRDLAFSGMFWMFAGFILACGATHFFSLAALWRPLYRVEGLVKAETAVLSLLTAGALWRLLPRILLLPNISQVLLDNASAVRQGEEQLHQLVNSIPQLAWMARADGWIFWYNRRWYDYTGTTPEQMQGWGWRDVHSPDLLAQILSDWKKAIDGGQPFEMEFPLRGVDGTFRMFLTRVEPIRDERGEVLCWFGTNTDIEEKRLSAEERERLLANERLARGAAERASCLKDEFLATVSHELRTPLNAIVGWSHLLLSPKVSEAETAKGLETILRNARAQAQIIDDLLDMSRIISGKLRLDIQTVDLPQILGKALDTMRPTAEAKGVRIETVINPFCPTKGDPDRLQQIFWNLLSNAIRFTPKGGKIQLVLERVHSHLEVRLSDTGEGIDPDFLPFIFDRFRQQDGSIARRHGGLGLGLSIVKNLVELHGGQIHAESPGVGKGATFVVRLPVSLTDLAETFKRHMSLEPPPPPEEVGEPSLAHLKILIVDDEPDTREIIQRTLESSDATVWAAASASEALKLLRREKPHLLISDIGMPSEDGYWLIRQVRALDPDHGGAIPAVALTALARTDDRRRALRSGYQAHIAKPVEPAELLYIVAGLAGRTPGALPH